MPSLYDEIARRLKSEREARRLSQQELAARLGVASNTISRWETGTNKVRLEDLDRVAVALGLNVGDLLPQYASGATSRMERLLRIAESLEPEDIAELEQFAEFRRLRRLQP